MGGTHVVLRKVDGEEILSRVERDGVTLLCGAPAVVAAVLAGAEARQAAGRTVPGRGTVRIVGHPQGTFIGTKPAGGQNGRGRGNPPPQR